MIFEYGQAVGIAFGLIEARKRHAGWKSFSTEIDAQEFAAWWNYTRSPPWLSTTARISSPSHPSL
ncbi:MAG: hypothetical protein KJ944_19345 [Alphaproteobacteria bacterium]|nr:hypothetical protein [Alphaproteobacteria bacterium]MBU1560771.1 hypothetical protein [Alphaproteobacteria bacterium]MBU2304745.1 hypothetical protein [Alphaproteobacteria bacterium]MBU2370041.1 hypothetical protein [Alphaproteobacteria bacterium]